ncbi:MAG TPA: hypothetical protein VFE40_12665, partial [Jatrophihabitantaceae bacterium]|nr:hypothetical protein [Jatrophihabitantaceae bacterium]
SLTPAEVARHVFVTAADHAFWTATIFLVGTWLLVALAIRTRRPAPAMPDQEVELELALAE